MSAVEATIRPRPRVPAPTKAAIIAALGAGNTQAQVAHQFKVHPNTVAALWKIVKQDKTPANIANLDWKSKARSDAQQAVTDGMTQRKDVVSAANIGLKVLYGIGDLSTSSKVEVDADVRLTVAWQPVQGAEYATGVQSVASSVDSTIDTQHRMLSDGSGDKIEP